MRDPALLTFRLPLLQVESFQGLAQNCLAACIHSLTVAQQRIEQRKSAADGQLFLVKHLLILREQMTPFNVEFRVKETTLDFSDIKSERYGPGTSHTS